MNYPLKSLDELGFVGRGKSKHRPRDAAHLYGGPYPFIQTGDVKAANFYIREFNQTYSEEGLKQSKLWSRGTLCITIAANIADTAILDIDACFPDSIIGFVADPKEADTRYVKYLFNDLKRQFKMFSQGAAQDNLSQEKLLSIKFPIPPVDKQKEIADILFSYDKMIEINNNRIRLLENAGRQIYHEWFVRMRFPGHERTHVHDGLPDGWERVKLKDIAFITMGQSPKSDHYNEDGEGLPFHQGVTGFDTRFVIDKVYSKYGSRLANEGDILCSVRAPVGRLNITLNDIIIGRGLSAMTSKNGLQSLLFYQLKFHFHTEDLIGTGAIFASVNKKDLENQELIQPSAQIASEFEKQVGRIDSQIKNLTLQNQKLRRARDFLLPRLMRGELLP